MNKFELSYAEHFLEALNPHQAPISAPLSFATPQQATLNEIDALGSEMISKKSSKIFKVVRSFGDAPSLQLLPFGYRFCAVLNGMKTNPYLLGTIPCVQLAPRLQLQKDLIQQHQLYEIDHLHPSFEIAVDQYMAHYKMLTLTQKHKSLENSWKRGLGKGLWLYENFITNLLGMTCSFDLYCITLINDVSKTNHENLSRNYLLFDHHIQEIVSTAQDAKKANILGIVGKWEANRSQQVNLHLLFFVAKKTSDFTPFEETEIYKSLNQFIDQIGLIQVVWTPLPKLLTPIFYNVNQINFGKRLQILKAYLVGTDHFLRIFDNKSSFEVFYQADEH
ncbi:hypothetical protein RMB03_00530 [Acinetobacter sp. V91_7]|uniref:hypothetical protein n=2 Tax=Acinetobacter TaxID=469 RepID=UPI00287D49D2|nr:MULTISPECIES: hypothetical protein [unclassified Acinetobacter]MDS7932479.1 hypothetical protein [Acinetobacter sp. V91_4B]MDS7961447.1 hypothetical protein [Acinetobacter sp. V91_7]MDS8025956.1 hypothetical protein [Acinetobacter sp. V91_13]